MPGYEILPDDEDTYVDIDLLLDVLRDEEDPVIDLIIHQYRINEDGRELFLRMHENRKDEDDLNPLGISKLFRAHRDCCAKILIDIAHLKKKGLSR